MRRRRAPLARPELERRLDVALTVRLTTLTAAPGYGKSLLLERWGEEVGAVTHRLVPEDRHLLHLARRVTAALRLRVPGLTTELENVLASPLGPDGASDPATRAAALAATLGGALSEVLRRHLVLILDDVDVLAVGDPATHFLESLLRSAPLRLHLVTASRVPPPLQLARLRDQGQVAELTAADLALDLTELRQWSSRLLGSDELAGEVLRRSGGWPVAAVATMAQLAKVAPDERAEHLESLAPVPVVEDLVLERFEAQSPAVRRLLRAGALLPSLTADLADALGLPGGALEELHRAGVLLDVDAADPDVFRLTPTAREVLTRHHGLDDAEAREVATRAAAHTAAAGRPDLALAALLAVEAPAALRDLLLAHETDLRGPATAEAVLRAIASLPPGMAREAGLLRVAGIAHQDRGDWELAREVLTQVADTGAFDAGVAWRLGLNHHLRGDLDLALEIYERGASMPEPAADATICAAWAASARWLRGEREACAAQAEEAMARATDLDDSRALAAAHMVLAMLAALDGDRRANDAHYLRAIEHAERAGDMPQLIRIRSNRASHHLEEGSFQDALAELEVARRLADLTGFTPFGALTLSNRAEALVGLGHLEEATVDAADAVAAWRSLGSRLVVYGLDNQARVQALRGDTSGAIATFREAVTQSEAIDDVQGLVPTLARLAELLVDEDPAEAREVAERAVAHGDGMGYVTACLAAARVALAGDRRVDAMRHLEEATRTAEQRRDRPGLARAAELEAVLTRDPGRAAEAVRRWRDLGDVVGTAGAELTRAELSDDEEAAAAARGVAERLHAIGCHLHDHRIDALLARALPGDAPRLTILTLGSFAVLRDGVPVPRTAWQSRKARDLVKLLASRRGRPVAREWLIERLWPDADAAAGPGAGAKRLNVMASTARGVLVPDRRGGEVIVSDGDTMQLDLRFVDLDVDLFLRDVERAARLDREGRHTEALACWRRAERRYGGDFCEDEVYAEWPVGVREEARAAYAQAVGRLARAATHGGDHDGAVRLWLRLLERDPYDERAHLDLVGALLAAGRPGDARRRYLTYTTRMAELEVEPAAFPTPAAAVTT